MRDQIEASVRKFVTDITALVRRQAIESLGGHVEKTVYLSPGTYKPGELSAALFGTDEKPTPQKGNGSGQKRDPRVLARLVVDLNAHIVKNAGANIETIAKAMKKSTAELSLPIAKLLASRRIKKTGQKRATRYFPAGWGR